MSDRVTILFSVQVHLTTEPFMYSKIPGATVGEKVNKNLFLDLSQSHIYITTEKKVCMSEPFCNVTLITEGVQAQNCM